MRAYALFWWMAATVERGRRSGRRTTQPRSRVLAPVAGSSRRSPGDVAIEEDAREELERSYLGGRPALLPDGEKEWGRFADLVDGLWGIAEAHAKPPLKRRSKPKRSVGRSTTSASRSV
jgi:hypothetical protein